MKWKVIVVVLGFFLFGNSLPAPALQKLFGEENTGSQKQDSEDHAHCEKFQDIDCKGELSSVVTKFCPVMCSQSSPICERLQSPLDCLGENAEEIQTKCPAMCSDKKIVAALELDEDDPGCTQFTPLYCLNEYAQIFKIKCPVMCSGEEETIAAVINELTSTKGVEATMIAALIGEITSPKGVDTTMIAALINAITSPKGIEATMIAHLISEITSPEGENSVEEEKLFGMIRDEVTSAPIEEVTPAPIEEVTPAPIEEVTDFPSCKHLLQHDCWGPHEKVVLRDCPKLCGSVTPAPIKEVTDFPSCKWLFQHDCWGRHEKVVLRDCPKLCGSVMGNTKEANQTRESYRPPKWAWTNMQDEPSIILNASTPAAKVTDHGSCVHLTIIDCLGEHASVVSKNCPILCAAATKLVTGDTE